MSDNSAATKSLGESGARIALRRAAGYEIVHVKAIQRDVILIDACACYGARIRHSGLHCEECGRVVSLLHRKAVQCLYVKRVADGCSRGIDRDFRVRSEE